MQHNDFLRGVKEAIPVALGFIPFGLVLGAQAAQKGFLPWQISLFTGTNFAGGSEFTAISLWTDPVNIGLVVAMSALVNSRYFIMGATFSLYLKGYSKLKSMGMIFLMCDESWAMGIADAQKQKQKTLNAKYYMGVSLLLYLTWIFFTGLGAYFGPILGDVKQYGFDMAFVAVFFVLLKGMWKGVKQSRPWLVSLIVAGICYHTFDGAWYVAGGAIAGIVAAYFWGE